METCVFFCPTDTWGGVEKNVLLRAKFLTEKNYKVYVVLLKSQFKDKFKPYPKINTISINSRGGDINLFVILNYVRILKNIKPSVVFVALKKDWFLVSLSSRIAGVKNIILYLGIFRKIKNNLKYKFVFNTLKPKVLVNSDSLKDYLLNTTDFFTQKNLTRIYNGFSLPVLSGDSFNFSKQLNIDKEAIIIGCAGRVSKIKGFDLLPEILNNLPNNVHVVIAGNDNYQPLVKEEIINSKHSSRIHFLGEQSNMDCFFRSIDIFLLSSRSEGMANVLNEAMSFGIPCVATKVGGSEECLDNGKYGYLCEIENTNQMADGINKIINKEVVYDSDLLRNRIKNSFSLEAMIKNTINLFFN